jgi:hypothetical protein
VTTTNFDRGFRRAAITDAGTTIRVDLCALLGKGRVKVIQTKTTISPYTAKLIAEDWLGTMVRWNRD